MTTRAEWLTVSGDPDVWRSIGVVVGPDGLVPLVGTCLKIDATPDLEPGIVSWSLSGIETAVGDVDGLVTTVVDPAPPTYAQHAIGAVGLDHVVVMTADLQRTSDAIERATGCELKRVREVGEMTQGFHRLGSGGLIVEIVERPEVPAGPASFWGLVINVDDLDAACAHIGADRVSAPKDAVQPGRRIATIERDVGLGLPVALMTP